MKTIQLVVFLLGFAICRADDVRVRTTPPPWFVPFDALWVCVARADCIATGCFGREEDRSDTRDFFVTEMLKGNYAVRRFRVSPPASLAEEDMDGERIAFLVFGRSEEEEPLSDGAPAWLVSDAGLPHATQSLVERIRGEIERQCHDLERFDTILEGALFPFQSEVVRLVGQMSASPETQCETVARLLSFGPDAAPAMILALGEDAPLPESSLMLPNRSESAMESARMYCPETVTDALSALIGHATGLGWETVMNGGSSEARRRDRDRWRTLLVRWNEARFVDGSLPLPCAASRPMSAAQHGSDGLIPACPSYEDLLALQRRAAGLSANPNDNPFDDP